MEMIEVRFYRVIRIVRENTGRRDHGRQCWAIYVYTVSGDPDLACGRNTQRVAASASTSLRELIRQWRSFTASWRA